MSISSSLGGSPFSMTAGETLGPQFRNLTASLESASLGLRGFTPALTSASAALKGFAAAAGPAGMKPLSQSFDLLASTVGTVVMPGFVLLGAAVGAAAATLMGELEPNLDKVAQWYADNIGVFEAFGKAVVTAGEAAYRAAVWFDKKANEGLEAIFGENQKNRVRAMKQDAILGVAMLSRPDFMGPPKPADPMAVWNRADVPDPAFQKQQQGGGFRNVMGDMLHAMVGGMKQDMGGAPGFRGIADAWRQNQMAAFENPMQAMIRQNWAKTIGVLEKVELLIRQNNAAPNAVNQGPNVAIAGGGN